MQRMAAASQDGPVARADARSSIAWAGLSLVGFLASGVIASVAFSPGLSAVAWTLLAAFGVLCAARIAFGAWPAVPVPAAAVIIAGVALSGAVENSLRDWLMVRYGFADPDMIGISAVFFAVVVGVAVAGFGALVAPRRAAWAPTLAALGGVALTALVVISNLPGLANGVDPESLPAAAAVGAASLYVAVVGVTSVRAWRRAG